MAATPYSVYNRYNSYATSAPYIASAFSDNQSNADLLQIQNEGGQVIAAVSYTGTVQFNASGLTASEGSGGTGLYTYNRQVVGQFRTINSNPAQSTLITTVAQAFAAAFSLNPQNWDIIQVISPGGTIGYYVDYLGVAHGS